MNKGLLTILRYLFFLGLGILFAWLSLKNLDKDNFSKIKQALINAKFWLAIPVFFILFLSHYVRALRWRLLIQPLGYSPSRINVFFAVMIGYLVNQGVPRLGEIMKCTVLSKYEKIPTDKLIGTIILERIIDALSLLIIFGITLAIQPDLYSKIIDTFFNQPGDSQKKKIPIYVVILITAGVFIVIAAIWMFIKKKSIKDVKQKLSGIVNRVMQGVGTVKHLKKRKEFILLTICLWALYLAGGYMGFKAFQETSHYGIKEAFSILSAGSIGMIASPGGIGAYAFLIQETMRIYGLNMAIATAFGWILWLATTAVIIIGGLISFVAIPYYNNQRVINNNPQ